MILKGRFAPLRLLTGQRISTRQSEQVLIGEGLRLRPPELDDFPFWERLRSESKSFLEPWEPLWPEDDLTRTAFRRRIRRYTAEIEADEAYPFLIWSMADGALLGGLTIGNVRRGAAQSATLGYWMGARYAGQGIMTRAVTLACRFGFGPGKLDRIEAGCLPENAASIRLLEKVGFRREGLARNYLSIAGRRRDHILFGLLSTDEMIKS